MRKHIWNTYKATYVEIFNDRRYRSVPFQIAGKVPHCSLLSSCPLRGQVF